MISFGSFIYQLFFLALFYATKQKSEQWVAVSYGRDLRYIGRVVKEDKQNITVIFLQRRAGGYFQLKRAQEEILYVMWWSTGRSQLL